MKDRILEAYYDEETGISQVILQTKWGTFEHAVVVSKEDEDIANKWDGCRFANYLCLIDKYRAKGKAFIERANGINAAADSLNQSIWSVTDDYVYGEPFTPSEMIAMMRDQAYYAERDGRKYLEIAKKMKEDYPEYIEQVLAERRKIRGKEQ